VLLVHLWRLERLDEDRGLTMRRQGFTLIELVLALGLAAVAVYFVTIVLAQSTTTARLASQAETVVRTKRLILNELQKGNAALAHGGSWDYGELGKVLKVKSPFLNRFRLSVAPKGATSLAGGGEVLSYDFTLCYRPVATGGEVCQSGTVVVPPPAAAQQGEAIAGTLKLSIDGEDPARAAKVTVEYDDRTETYTTYGTYLLHKPKRVTADTLLNAQGIRYQPTVSTGSDGYLVFYKATSGAIDLSIQTPDATFPSTPVDLEGPVSGQYDSSIHLPDMPPGTYRVAASQVEYKGFTYAPEYGGAADAAGAFELGRGEVARVSVAFGAVDGALEIDWQSTIAAPRLEVLRDDPTGQTPVATVTPDTRLEKLAPGSYVVSLAAPLVSGGYEYGLEFSIYDPNRGSWSEWFRPEDDKAGLPVQAGQISRLAVRAHPKTAVLEVEVVAPSGTQVGVSVGYPFTPGNGDHIRRIETPGVHRLTGLAPGRYAVYAEMGKKDATYYAPTPPSVDVDLGPGETKRVTITYAEADEGTLVVWAPTIQGGFWPNEPLGWTVDGTTFRHPGAQLIKPGDWVRVCGKTLEGQRITYEFRGIRDGNGYSSCRRLEGKQGALEVVQLTALYVPENAYLYLLNTLGKGNPSDDNPNLAAYLHTEPPPTEFLEEACDAWDHVKGGANDPNWYCQKEAKVRTGRQDNSFLFRLTTAEACMRLQLDVEVYGPDGYAKTYSTTRTNAKDLASPYTEEVRGKIVRALGQEVCK